MMSIPNFLPKHKKKRSLSATPLMIKLRFYRVYANLLVVLALALKSDDTVYESEESVILSDTYVGAGVKLGTTLANENVAGENELTVSALGAKALGLGVTAVLGGAHTFFMSEELKTDVHHNNVSILSVE